MRLSHRWLSSPYARALKHIALRGESALRHTAAEEELAMYRAGTLPIDYRPPRDTAWDDTVERWTYAWQFPLSEQKERITVEVAKEKAGIDALVDFAQRLITSPPSNVPRSSSASQDWPPRLEASPAQPTEAIESNSVLELAAEVFGEAPPTTTPTTTATTPLPAMKPAAQYSKESAIPVAYLDDGSELAQASRELCAVITDHLGLPYNDYGLAVAMQALVRNKVDASSLATLFSFVQEVGLGPTSLQYNALLFAAALHGDPERAVVLIEEMKERGITPTRVSWLFLARALLTARDPSGALQVLDNMKALANLEPTEFEHDLHFRCLAQDRDRLSAPYEAIQLLDQIEHVEGILPTRMLYTSYLSVLCRSSNADHRQRVHELGVKMEAIGMPWDLNVYRMMLASAGTIGDLSRTQELCIKMRDEGLQLNVPCLAEIISAHARSLRPHLANYTAMQEQGQSVLLFILDRLETGVSIFELALQRSLPVTTMLINRLLHLHCTAVSVAVDHLKDDEMASLATLENMARGVWEQRYGEGCVKNPQSYENFIVMLSALQRVDEAENLFIDLVQTQNKKPTRRTYEALIIAHLSSGEEGGTARALQYFEAMERVGYTIKQSAIQRMVRATDDAAYKRDMKRRARRIMQAREEYVARKKAEEAAAAAAQRDAHAAAPGIGATLHAFGGHEAPSDSLRSPPSPTRDSADGVCLVRDDSEATSLSWWERWRRHSINKHELFDNEREDGTPRGEDFAEKNEALRKMGIESKFLKPGDVPGLAGQRTSVLAKIRSQEGSEPAGALWGLDGGDSANPSTITGPDSWAVTFWRERQIIKKELEKTRSGHGQPAPFSTVGLGARTPGEQLAIERSGAKTRGELTDAMDYPDLAYDNGAAKPASELAVAPPPAGELIWVAEKRDKLGAYRTDEECVKLAGEDDSVLTDLRRTAKAKIDEATSVIRDRREFEASVVGPGPTRRSKYDYLEHFRELYRQGTIEAPENPIVSTGRTPDDHAESMAAQVRGWFASQRQADGPPPAQQLRRYDTDRNRARDEATVTREQARLLQRRAVPQKRSTHRAAPADGRTKDRPT